MHLRVEITHTLDKITRLSALNAKNLANCHQINYLFSALVNAFCVIFKFVLHIVSNSSIHCFMVYNNITLFNSQQKTTISSKYIVTNTLSQQIAANTLSQHTLIFYLSLNTRQIVSLQSHLAAEWLLHRQFCFLANI